MGVVSISNGIEHFNIDGFRGQTPWFGPYFGDRRMIVSSPGDGLPSHTAYRVYGWVLDASGEVLAECDFGERTSGVPVNYDLSEAFAGLPRIRGSLALLTVPENPDADVPVLNHAWTLRILGRGGLNDLLVSEVAKNINFPERTGRSGYFRLLSSQLCITDGWRSLACICNASANPQYSRSIRLSIAAFNNSGQRLAGPDIEVPPFGTYWLDPSEIFGTELSRHLGPGGRGSYVATSDDGQAIAYHFLYNPDTGDLAGDHTRPVMYYLRVPYGVTKHATDKSLYFKLRALASFVKFRITP